MSDTPDAGRLEAPIDRSPAENAQLALLLEVAGTPKPGNVDRHRDLSDLRFEQFLAGAIGAGRGLELAAAGGPIGEAFERAVAGMSTQRGGNTQLGCLLLLVPLVRAATIGDLTREGVDSVVESTTVEDAVAFYRAFDHVDVSVADPPAGWDALDVRRGSKAAGTVRDRELTLYDVMERSAAPTDDRPPDGNAREWVDGFSRSFAAADRLLEDRGPIQDRTARVFLELLAEEPDTLVAVTHGESVAAEVCRRAAALVDDLETAEFVDDQGAAELVDDQKAAAVGDDLEAAERLAEEFVERGINPGTTADITAAALYIALERGLEV